MKKTAILLYDSFCNFEISVALEILALAEKPITVFGITKQAIRSEDGLSIFPDDTIDNLDLDAYDSLILPGAMDIRETIENERIVDFIKKFEKKTIGAISIAPLLLVIAQAIMEKPDILMLDEPTNALDEEGIEQIRKIIKEERERGAIVLIASHNKEDIEVLADKVFSISNGMLKESEE